MRMLIPKITNYAVMQALIALQVPDVTAW